MEMSPGYKINAKLGRHAELAALRLPKDSCCFASVEGCGPSVGVVKTVAGDGAAFLLLS